MPVMRPWIVLVSLSLALGGCVLGRSGDDAVPSGDAWRREVLDAISQTPGVTTSSVVVRDVDSGTGHTGPVLTGGVVVTGDAQRVVDDVLRRASDALGQDSAGDRVNLGISADGAPAQHLDDFGYAQVSNGRSLWEATH